MSLRSLVQARSFFGASRATAPATIPPSPRLISADELVEEECLPGYDPKQFYPVTPGELLNGRYRVLTKLGFGRSSTVWLGSYEQNGWLSRTTRYVALKVCACDLPGSEAGKNERTIYQRLVERANKRHKGVHFVRQLIESFEIPGATANHICLAQELLREPLSIFQYRLTNGTMPVQLIKAYIKPLLYGLDYLHSQCRVIHTDLKLDNIMLTFEDPTVIDKFAQAATSDSSPHRKVAKEGRTVYQSQNNFGGIRESQTGLLPKITDFGLARLGDDVLKILREPIQAPVYHAPEVILGTGWSYSADIWNLGVLIWNMMEGRDLFRHLAGPKGNYEARRHVAEMVALLGPPPMELLRKEKLSKDVEWDDVYVNFDGKPAKKARDYYGGPFFDGQGNFLCPDLIPDTSLEESVPSLQGEQQTLFLDFIRKALQWVPEERATAKELLEHPWLDIKNYA